MSSSQAGPSSASYSTQPTVEEITNYGLEEQHCHSSLDSHQNTPQSDASSDHIGRILQFENNLDASDLSLFQGVLDSTQGPAFDVDDLFSEFMLPLPHVDPATYDQSQMSELARPGQPTENLGGEIVDASTIKAESQAEKKSDSVPERYTGKGKGRDWSPHR
jgi:hypothetical protein